MPGPRPEPTPKRPSRSSAARLGYERDEREIAGAVGASAQRKVRSPVQTRHRRRMQAAAVSRGGKVQAEAGLCVRTLHSNNCAVAALVGCGRG